MNTSAALRPSVRTAFGSLIDYAGLYPPAALDMPEAVAEYDAARRGPHAWMLGRFIVSASRLADLHAALVDRQAEARYEPFALSVIVDAGQDARRWFEAAAETLASIARVRSSGAPTVVESLEVPVPPLLTQRESFDAPIGQLGALIERTGLSDLPAYVEVPRGARWLELLPGALAAARRAGLGAKLRCGGVTADAFPSVADVTAFVTGATAAGVPFKATAGLHHPVRHLDAASGSVMHGFLNVLAAATFAPLVGSDTLERIVGEEDARAFAFDENSIAWRGERASTAELAAARERRFVAYGSCSFSEPVEDLTLLGILPHL